MRTFGRVAELQRHYDEQHVRAMVLDCVAVSCRAKGLKGFARWNKLSDHLKTHCSKNTLCLCPVPQCGAGPFPADLLQVHIGRHKPSFGAHNRTYIKIIKALTKPDALCPVQGCHEDLRRGHELDADHHIDTRKLNAAAILAAGYNPISGKPVCPVCNAQLKNSSLGEAKIEHFLSHDWELLYRYSREILKVLPGFGTHLAFRPVFADILPTEDRPGS